MRWRVVVVVGVRWRVVVVGSEVEDSGGGE